MSRALRNRKHAVSPPPPSPRPAAIHSAPEPPPLASLAATSPAPPECPASPPSWFRSFASEQVQVISDACTHIQLEAPDVGSKGGVMFYTSTTVSAALSALWHIVLGVCLGLLRMAFNLHSFVWVRSQIVTWIIYLAFIRCIV